MGKCQKWGGIMFIPWEVVPEDNTKIIKFHIVYGDIVDQGEIQHYNIDAVVNAARPTLMGSDQVSVDCSIHQAIDKALRNVGDTETFNDKIREELDGGQKKPENTIRCQRGKAVITKGYGLAKYVIHVVGTKYFLRKTNARKGWKGFCPSSSVRGLESCYYEIVELLKQYPDIRNIAVPVVGAGNYGFPLKYALQIEIVSLFNAVVEWYRKDPEIFSVENSGNRGNSSHINIYLYIYDDGISEEQRENIDNILGTYEKYFGKNKKISFQESHITHFHNLSEVCCFDHDKGYFAIARSFRALLLLIRTFFLPVQLLAKDVFGGCDWEKRRRCIEILSVVKALSGVLFWALSSLTGETRVQYILMGISAYFLVDTVTYLFTLIVLGDILRPSANIIRSLFLLLINYMEVSLDLAYLYYCFRKMNFAGIRFYEAVAFAFFGTLPDTMLRTEQIFVYVQQGLGFLFITFAFAYYLSNMQVRRFLS